MCCTQYERTASLKSLPEVSQYLWVRNLGCHQLYKVTVCHAMLFLCFLYEKILLIIRNY